MIRLSTEIIKSLNQNELDMLLYMANCLCPIRIIIPTPEDPYPVTPLTICSMHKEAVFELVRMTENKIKDEFKFILNGLKMKLGLPCEPTTDLVGESNVSGSAVSGSINS